MKKDTEKILQFVSTALVESWNELDDVCRVLIIASGQWCTRVLQLQRRVPSMRLHITRRPNLRYGILVGVARIFNGAWG